MPYAAKTGAALALCLMTSGCILLNVTPEFHPVLLDADSAKTLQADDAVVALEANGPVILTRFDRGRGAIPQWCWSYLHFQTGPNPPSAAADALTLQVFRIPEGDYLISALARGDRFAFTAAAGQRIYLGRFTQDTHIGGKQASDDIRRRHPWLAASGFAFEPDIVSHPGQPKPPFCVANF